MTTQEALEAVEAAREAFWSAFPYTGILPTDLQDCTRYYFRNHGDEVEFGEGENARDYANAVYGHPYENDTHIVFVTYDMYEALVFLKSMEVE